MEGAADRNRVPGKRAVRRTPPSSLGIKASRRTWRVSSPSITEGRNPAIKELDTGDTLSTLRLIHDQDTLVPAAVKLQIRNIAQAVNAAVRTVRGGGRIIYVGAGTSGRLGVLDAAECPPTFGVPPRTVQAVIAGGPRALVRAAEAAEDDRERGRRDLAARKIAARDIVIGLSASGRTLYTLGALAYARSQHAATVAVTNNPGSPITRVARISITPATGAEVLVGSTRMKAALAQKMILHMISTAVMVRLGHVYKNYMVGVRPTNRKLVERAINILVALTGVNAKSAGRALRESGNNVKIAFVMLRRGLTRAAAKKLLRRHGGNLRAIDRH